MLLPSAFTERLAGMLGDRFIVSEAVRRQHGRDESAFDAMPPDAVAYPLDAQEARQIVLACAEHGVPIVPYGAGSSLEGQTLATRGGLTINMQRMDTVLAIDAEDFTATVQPGVTRKALNAALRDSGLFFPIDPGADASIGGMASTRASGTNAVRYQTMRENVVNLTAILADGRVVKTGQRARKSSAGYDLTRLFVGSEGTLGLVTEITVRLYPLPESVTAAVCSFENIDGAVQAVTQAVQLGIPVTRCEFVDALAIRALNRYSKTTMPEAPHLFLEFHGDEAGTRRQAEQMQEICSDLGGAGFQWAATPEERSKLWEARHNAYFATLQLRPGSRGVVTDVCVPISRLAECVTETAADLADCDLLGPIVGHVGDGNFHVQILIDPNVPEERERAEALNHRIVQRALRMDGTCTGEHGIGLHKKEFLVEELGEVGVGVMRQIKQALDPQGLFNPDKVF